MYYFVYSRTSTYSQKVLERQFKKRILKKMLRDAPYSINFHFNITELSYINKNVSNLINGFVISVENAKAAMMLRMDPRKVTKLDFKFGFHIDDVTKTKIYDLIEQIEENYKQIAKYNSRIAAIKSMFFALNKFDEAYNTAKRNDLNVVEFFDAQKCSELKNKLDLEAKECYSNKLNLENNNTELRNNIRELFDNCKFV